MRDMVRSSRYLGTIEGVRKLRPVAALAALFFLLGLTILLSGCGEDTPTAEPTATATATHTRRTRRHYTTAPTFTATPVRTVTNCYADTAG